MKNCDEKYARALKKVEIKKDFYRHLAKYVIINSGLILWWSNLFGSGKLNFNQPGIYVVLFFWGIGLFWHGMYVLYEIKLKKFGRQWERRKVVDILEKEEDESRRFKTEN